MTVTMTAPRTRVDPGGMPSPPDPEVSEKAKRRRFSAEYKLASGVTTMVANLALHVAGIAVVLLVLLIPSLARRLDRLLAAYPGGPA